nr:immunoglobulin light chain junction region [Macaca mulatta]
DYYCCSYTSGKTFIF